MKKCPHLTGLGIALLLASGLWGFVELEDAELDTWAAPADAGEYVVSLRVDRGDWHAFDDACRQVAPLLPESHPGDGQTTHYQSWRNSGWRRMNDRIDVGASLQTLANRINAFSCENCRICVVDSHGHVDVPKN